jgi:hypothetical protein
MLLILKFALMVMKIFPWGATGIVAVGAFVGLAF